MEFRHILFPVDFSPESYRVSAHVRAMAGRFDAAVTVYHVLETAPLWAAADDGVLVPDFDLSAVQNAAEQKLRGFAEQVMPELKPARFVDEGRPGPNIARLAKTWGGGLIAMSTHGHGPFRTALLGSTTSAVLHDSDAAVWTAAHMKDDPQISHLAWNKILCAIDLLPESIPLIRAAAVLGKKCRAPVLLVHAGAGIDRLSALQAEAGTNFNSLVEPGDVSKVVREAAAREDVDLVIIGRGANKRFGGRLRTHAWSIIRDSPCPVLSL